MLFFLDLWFFFKEKIKLRYIIKVGRKKYLYDVNKFIILKSL